MIANTSVELIVSIRAEENNMIHHKNLIVTRIVLVLMETAMVSVDLYWMLSAK